MSSYNSRHRKKIIGLASGIRLPAFFAALLLLSLSLVAPSFSGISKVWAQSPPGPTGAASPAAPVAPAPAPATAAATVAPSESDVAGGYGYGVAADAANGAGNLSADDLKSTDKLAEAAGQNRVAINTVWTLICGFLVMFMQAGFAMVETGFCRAKHAAHVIMTNFMIYPIGMLGYWICGFAFMFGSVGAIGNLGLGADVLNSSGPLTPFIGLKGFFLTGAGMYHPAVYTLFLFQMVFMDTTCTIPTGAMAERWKFSAFVVYGFFISMVIYPIFGHWVWGLGWLAQLATTAKLGHGAVDFAGSGVVHAIGGWVGLAGAQVIGARIGKYDPVTKKPRTIPGHHIPMAIIGCFILAFGWFGFNPGSTLGASGGGNLRIGVVATNTMLASASGAVAAMFYWWKRYGKPDIGMSANGLLAGLVAITAPCAFTNAFCSLIIGLVAGILVCVAIPFFENRGIDDPVGAVSVHGVCGIWGVISVGIFADGTYGKAWNGGPGDYGPTGILFNMQHGTGQLIAQLIYSVVAIAWAYGMGLIFFKIQHAVQGIRSSKEDEIAGLDIPEIGVSAYPEFQKVEVLEA